ncbi:DUF2254 domain-containing protein [Kaistella sp. G5-32]|uniref:DUF2254 domain-containing protein n=1 Tax=Kaistella gelatinilytica TaxID=2787636 RepID=A0ABS0F8F0_9FLAO|nr:DUF2254 domain-containing protein [Kaistella gelatinilytica]MBF8455925.1 DUF2254 domain-containing protein [Kaistella gelatinilytica]
MSFPKWSRIYYNKMVESIAFYPALIAVGFLFLSWVMLVLDFSPFGKELKSNLSWLSLKDAGTARTIISTVAGAIISLTVFSFSMVMIVLNQAASQMSNRVLNSMIENRFQQVILGIYIGTIVYALFLLSTIRDISSGIYVPALSIYLLILLTVIDIFLFIYFLDYVTQTVKYETVIDRVRKQTFLTMKKDFEPIKKEIKTWENLPFVEIKADRSGYFQGFNEKRILHYCDKNDLYVSFYFQQGTFILENSPCMRVYGKGEISEDQVKNISECADFFSGQPIDRSADYGFNQLAEIALKGLSPGINDPATAVLSLHALFSLLQYKMTHELPELLFDDQKTARIYRPSSTFLQSFEKCIIPIWNYGKEDQYIQNELLGMIKQLKQLDAEQKFEKLFEEWIEKIQLEKAKMLNS